MDIQFEAKVVKILDPQRFNGKNGELVKYEFICETNEQFPRQIALSYFGEDKHQKFGIQLGLTYTFFVDLVSREWNGKWFTSVSLWKVESNSNEQNVQAAPYQPMEVKLNDVKKQVEDAQQSAAPSSFKPQPQSSAAQDAEDDLPF